MPYIIKFQWLDCPDFDTLLHERRTNREDTEIKELYEGGRGAMYHPRFEDAKPIGRMVHGCSVVEWKGRAYMKEDIPKVIENVKSHLRSFGITQVNVGEPVRVNIKEFETYDRKRKPMRPKTKRRSVKRCKCK